MGPKEMKNRQLGEFRNNRISSNIQKLSIYFCKSLPGVRSARAVSPDQSVFEDNFYGTAWPAGARLHGRGLEGFQDDGQLGNLVRKLRRQVVVLAGIFREIEQAEALCALRPVHRERLGARAIHRILRSRRIFARGSGPTEL